MATIEVDLECDKVEGITPDPNNHKRHGYVTKLKGFGQQPIEFKPDIVCFCPFNNGTPRYKGLTLVGNSQNTLGKATVVGILEKIHWSTAVGGTIDVDVWMSQQNSNKIKTAQQSTLTSTRVDEFGFWVGNYDQELKIWFEQFYPNEVDVVTGLVGPQGSPEINVDVNGTPVVEGLDAMLYKVSLKIAPGADKQYGMFVANSPKENQVKPWGLVVGTWAQGAYG